MILDRIVAVKREEVERGLANQSVSDLRARAFDLPSTRGFESKVRTASLDVALIAEVKKASPSKGIIREQFDPVDIAKTYEQAGAQCLSVLTDVSFFQGSPRYIGEIRREVSLPILRKDFMIDEKQIYESRMIGADAILLIVAILTPAQVKEYSECAQEMGLSVLVEVHDENEMQIAINSGATLIGVNNRDLRDFSVDLGTTARLSRMLPDDRALVAESGIHTHDDVRFVQAAGARAILVGEAFMKQADIGQAVASLMGRVQS